MVRYFVATQYYHYAITAKGHAGHLQRDSVLLCECPHEVNGNVIDVD